MKGFLGIMGGFFGALATVLLTIWGVERFCALALHAEPPVTLMLCLISSAGCIAALCVAAESIGKVKP